MWTKYFYQNFSGHFLLWGCLCLSLTSSGGGFGTNKNFIFGSKWHIKTQEFQNPFSSKSHIYSLGLCSEWKPFLVIFVVEQVSIMGLVMPECAACHCTCRQQQGKRTEKIYQNTHKRTHATTKHLLAGFIRCSLCSLSEKYLSLKYPEESIQKISEY